MDGASHQFLAGPGFAEQHDGRIGIGDTQDLLQHGNEGRRAADQALRRRPAARLTDDAHGLDKIGDSSLVVAYRRRLDGDMLLAVRCVVQMQDALRIAILQAQLERTGFARLVARHIETMRHLVAHAPRERRAVAELADVGGVGGNDAVIGAHHDARLGQSIKEGNQLAQEVGSHARYVTTVKIDIDY